MSLFRAWQNGRSGRALLAVGAGCVLMTASCGSSSSTGVDSTAFNGHLEALHPGSIRPADLGSADQRFGMRLLHDVCTAAPGMNTVLSPASATQALGMMQTGAHGLTRTALSALLHQPAYGPAVIAAQNKRTAHLSKVAGLSTSNRLFTQTGTTPQQATLNDLRTAYNTQLQTLDFSGRAKSSTDTINHLVSDDTHGRIPQLFADPLDSSTVTVLTNAIYLKARWQYPFEAPVPGTFNTTDGKRITVPTLNNSQPDAPSASAGGWQSAQLPYVHGQLTAYALLPPATAKTCAVPDTATLTALLRPNPQGAATVTMPQFHLTRTNDLLRTLTSEGLPPAGDYSGFGSSAAISQIVQKVDISVDQNGTTAAAATGGVFTTSGRASTTHINLNRPFLFLITDTTTHTPLFLTRIADPRG